MRRGRSALDSNSLRRGSRSPKFCDLLQNEGTSLRRTDGELRDAQRALAGVAASHPRLGCVEAREAELEEVLGALGLLRRIA